VLLQAGLLPTPDFHAFDRRYLSVYLTIAIVACGLFFVGSLTSVNFFACRSWGKFLPKHLILLSAPCATAQ